MYHKRQDYKNESIITNDLLKCQGLGKNCMTHQKDGYMIYTRGKAHILSVCLYIYFLLCYYCFRKSS